ncbi:MAG: anion transporter [Planctomycetes bacterium]|nr:anion transporter [Planctomycetota bacterium]
MTALAVAIFCLTYVLIAARRLRVLPIGRPAGALLGAVLMVGARVITPEASFKAIDHDTIVLLLGMMLITAYMDQAAFFDWLVTKVLAVCATPWSLLVVVALLAGGLSAVLVNDTVCLFMTPVVVATCARARLPLGPYLIALATSANIGSAATLVGNPQNMIIGSLSRMPFGEFLLRCGPAALVGLLVNVALLRAYYGRSLPALMPPLEAAPPRAGPPGLLRRVSVVLLLVVVAFFAGAHLGYAALAGAVALIVLERAEPREAFARVDWALLVFFCALFVVVHGLASTGLVEAVWTRAAPWLDLERAQGVSLFTGLVVVGSNLVSNVPLVLLAGPHLQALGGPSPALGWALLAFISTVAGNLTLIGSVANIIVAEGAKDHYTLGFVEYLRFGLVSTLVVLAAGVPVIVLASRALG